MTTITFKDVLSQLKDDLIGKDSQRGITLTYAWMANQFGHLALGFIPTFLVYHYINEGSVYKNAFMIAFFIACFWLFFELYNFLGPLLLNKISLSKAMYIPKKDSYVFRPAWYNIAFDTFADLCFFSLGGFLFALTVEASVELAVFICLLVLIIAVVSRYWFLVKMYQQFANMPFAFRLSQWNHQITAEDKSKIIDLLYTKETGNHILIFGSHNSGKSTLGVGLLNEIAIKHKSCYYSSATKLATSFLTEEYKQRNYINSLWEWKECGFLLIDDINPGKPIKDEFMSACDFKSMINKADTYNTEYNVAKTLVAKNIIWVLGNYEETEIKDQTSWENMLINIGVGPEKIKIVNLG